MMIPRQYEDSLRRLNLKVYLFGRKIGNVVALPTMAAVSCEAMSRLPHP